MTLTKVQIEESVQNQTVSFFPKLVPTKAGIVLIDQGNLIIKCCN